jgi:hypothetical protein
MLQDSLREIKAEIIQLRDKVDDKPDRKGLENYLNAKLQPNSLENHTKNAELRNIVAHLEKSFNERLQGSQTQLEMFMRQLTGEGKANRKNIVDTSKMQLMESNIEFLFDKLDSIS